MRFVLIFALCIIVGCKNNEEETPAIIIDTSIVKDSVTKVEIDTATIKIPVTKQDPAKQDPSSKQYANARFKNVKVHKLGNDKYKITGQAQVFEASFSWSLHDGVEELQSGHSMTDAGAPEFGKFSFIITAKKKRANSTLTLTLFEASAQDGRRQHELPIPIY